MTKTNVNIKVERKHHQIDATDQVVGRLATKIAGLLTGKGKINYSPQIDNGDFVLVANVDKMLFKGKKLMQKKLYSHSGYPGGLKIKKLSKLYQDNPADVIRKTVTKMLPKNKFRDKRLKRILFKK
ncbi:MAG: 50S ribosomal protein L13 [Candidatus Parcubacteria bacterium]|nr:50S ribosomal protein L13 [Candidatus Parcubacteria bacterium]